MQQIIGFSAWLLVALVAAALVMVAAAFATTERFGAGRGVAGMLTDLKAAWASLRGRGTQSAELTSDEVSRIVDAPPVETTMVDFFRANVEEGAGYVQAAEITARLGKAADTVRTTVPQRGPRSAA